MTLVYNSDRHAYVGSRIAVDQDAMVEAMAALILESIREADRQGVAYDGLAAREAAWAECSSEDAWPLDAAGVSPLAERHIRQHE